MSRFKSIRQLLGHEYPVYEGSDLGCVSRTMEMGSKGWFKVALARAAWIGFDEEQKVQQTEESAQAGEVFQIEDLYGWFQRGNWLFRPTHRSNWSVIVHCPGTDPLSIGVSLSAWSGIGICPKCNGEQFVTKESWVPASGGAGPQYGHTETRRDYGMGTQGVGANSVGQKAVGSGALYQPRETDQGGVRRKKDGYSYFTREKCGICGGLGQGEPE